MNTDRHSGRRWFYLALGDVVLLFSGIIYAWSILKAPLAVAFGWSAAQLSVNYTLTMSFFCLGGIAGSAIGRRTGPRWVMALAAVLACGGLTAAARITGSSIAALYLSYGVCCSLGIGMAYNAILATVCAWFPGRVGLSSGCLMMGFGASTLVVGSAAEVMISAPGWGWRMAYTVLGAALGVMLLLAALLLRRPAEGGQPSAQSAPAGAGRTPGQMLRTPSFWLSFFYVMLLAAAGSTVIAFARDISLSVGMGAPLAAALVGILSVCNGLGRVITGAAIDAFGEKRVMLTANFVTIGAVILLLAAVRQGSAPLCAAGLCLTGLAFGANPSLSATLVAAFYGPRYYSANLSLMGLNLLGTAGMASAAGVILTAAGSYAAPLTLLLGLALVGLALDLLLWRVRKREN